MKTSFGQALYNLARIPSVQRVLEIGTWKGGGSSLCLASGLRDGYKGANGASMITIEGFEAFHQEARKTLEQYPVRCLLGSASDPNRIATIEQVRKWSKDTLNGGKVAGAPESEWSKWHLLDAQVAATYEVGLVKPLCKKYRKYSHSTGNASHASAFDLVLLDGAEFMGPADFITVYTHCRPRFIAMHDTLAFKNWMPREWLMDGKYPGYHLFQEERTGPGWSIFERG